MHRIDGPNTAPGNLFREGDPAVGTPATTLTDDWCNAVQEEIAGVIVASGIVLNKPDNAQLLEAILRLQRFACPRGTVIQGYWQFAPDGFLFIDGQVINRAAFPGLFNFATAEGLIVSEASWLGGATSFFSSGNGTTTFRMPDIRGEFVRGFDAGRGVDVGRARGSLQGDMIRSHAHPLQQGVGFGGNYPDQVNQDGNNSLVTGATEVFGGVETRPRNVALSFAMKY